MKSPGEVIAEGLIASITSKEPHEIQRSLRYLKNKCIQINFPNLHEAIVIYFDKNPEKEFGIRYEIHPTPIFHCKRCGWQGTISDLPINEKKVKIKNLDEIVWEQNALMDPILRKIIEICPECGSKRLIRKEYRHKGRDLYIIGTHNDIAKLGAIIDPVIPHRIDGIINAFWSFFISEKIKFRPLWRVGLAIQFARLLL